MRYTLEALFEEEKLKLGTEMAYLKSCSNYRKERAITAMEKIRNICWRITTDENMKKISNSMVEFMINEGFGRLIVKMVKSSNQAAVAFRNAVSVTLTHLLYHMHHSNKAAYQKMITELINCGIIKSLVKELDRYNPQTENVQKQSVIINNLIDQFNLHRSPHAIMSFRKARAVKVLAKFVKSDNVMIKVDSLRVLAIIANEEESQQLTATSECILRMLNVLEIASQTDDRK